MTIIKSSKSSFKVPPLYCIVYKCVFLFHGIYTCLKLTLIFCLFQGNPDIHRTYDNLASFSQHPAVSTEVGDVSYVLTMYYIACVHCLARYLHTSGVLLRINIFLAPTVIYSKMLYCSRFLHNILFLYFVSFYPR